MYSTFNSVVEYYSYVFIRDSRKEVVQITDAYVINPPDYAEALLKLVIPNTTLYSLYIDQHKIETPTWKQVISELQKKEDVRIELNCRSSGIQSTVDILPEAGDLNLVNPSVHQLDLTEEAQRLQTHFIANSSKKYDFSRPINLHDALFILSLFKKVGRFKNAALFEEHNVILLQTANDHYYIQYGKNSECRKMPIFTFNLDKGFTVHWDSTNKTPFYGPNPSHSIFEQSANDFLKEYSSILKKRQPDLLSLKIIFELQKIFEFWKFKNNYANELKSYFHPIGTNILTVIVTLDKAAKDGLNVVYIKCRTTNNQLNVAMLNQKIEHELGFTINWNNKEWHFLINNEEKHIDCTAPFTLNCEKIETAFIKMNLKNKNSPEKNISSTTGNTYFSASNSSSSAGEDENRITTEYPYSKKFLLYQTNVLLSFPEFLTHHESSHGYQINTEESRELYVSDFRTYIQLEKTIIDNILLFKRPKEFSIRKQKEMTLSFIKTFSEQLKTFFAAKHIIPDLNCVSSAMFKHTIMQLAGDPDFLPEKNKQPLPDLFDLKTYHDARRPVISNDVDTNWMDQYGVLDFLFTDDENVSFFSTSKKVMYNAILNELSTDRVPVVERMEKKQTLRI